jgi:site-specific DNA recombinase
MEHNAAREAARTELARVTRELDRLVQALMEGVSAPTVKNKLGELEHRKADLRAQLEQTGEAPVLEHPNMALHYRERVASLRDALNDPEHRIEAAEIMRTLIDRIELTPVTDDGRETIAVDLNGHIAGILSLAADSKKLLGENDDSVKCTKMVGGVQPPRLPCPPVEI